MKIPDLIPGLIFILLVLVAMGVLFCIDQGILTREWYNISIVLAVIGIGLMWYTFFKKRYKKWSEKIKRFMK